MKPKLISMGRKHGAVPKETAWLDVTHFRNPHSVEALRNLPGTSWQVADYIANTPRFHYAYTVLYNNVRSLLAEGETIIYIICTGGQHRSVYLAEKLARDLNLDVAHRDLRSPTKGTQ